MPACRRMPPDTGELPGPRVPAAIRSADVTRDEPALRGNAAYLAELDRQSAGGASRGPRSSPAGAIDGLPLTL